MLGWPAAVMETESPSQLMPSEIHRIWTSSTPDGFASNVAAMTTHPLVRYRFLLELERVDKQLLARDYFHIQSSTARAAQREVLHHALRAALPAATGRRHRGDPQLAAIERRTLHHQIEGEAKRVGSHLAQVSHCHLHPGDTTSRGMTLGDVHDCLGYRELVRHTKPRGGGRP